MPAKYVDMGSYGYGVKFPKKPKIDNATYRELISLGFEKKPYVPGFEQLFLTSALPIEKVQEYIHTYNQKHYD